MTEPTPIGPRIEKKELEDVSQQLAESLQKNLPEGAYFALFIYRNDGSGAIKYLSSGEWPDVESVFNRIRRRVLGIKLEPVEAKSEGALSAPEAPPPPDRAEP